VFGWCSLGSGYFRQPTLLASAAAYRGADGHNVPVLMVSARLSQQLMLLTSSDHRCHGRGIISSARRRSESPRGLQRQFDFVYSYERILSP
jgi:hypothetical protein